MCAHEYYQCSNINRLLVPSIPLSVDPVATSQCSGPASQNDARRWRPPPPAINSTWCPFSQLSLFRAMVIERLPHMSATRAQANHTAADENCTGTGWRRKAMKSCMNVMSVEWLGWLGSFSIGAEGSSPLAQMQTIPRHECTDSGSVS